MLIRGTDHQKEKLKWKLELAEIIEIELENKLIINNYGEKDLLVWTCTTDDRYKKEMRNK